MLKYKLIGLTVFSSLIMAGKGIAVDESVTITATVPAWAVIEPSTSAARIVLDGRLGAAEFNETLLTLNLSHNSSIGYVIQLKSSNNGKLIGTRDPSRSIPYKISYDSKSPVSLTYTPQDIGGATTSVTGAATTPVTKSVDIIIDNRDANRATQQDYEDTIIFTLTGI